MTYMVSALNDIDFGVSLSEAILSFDGDALEVEINRLIRNFLKHDALRFERSSSSISAMETDFTCPISADTYYVLSGKNGRYDESDLHHLNFLAGMTARLFKLRQDVDQKHALNLREHMLQTQILDQIHESVIIMDLAGFILSWNRGAEKMFGYAASEVLGRNILFLYEDEDANAQGKDILDDFLTNGANEMEVRRRRKNGDVFWASLTLSVIAGLDSQPVGIVGYLSDITHRKEAEEKINQLAYFDTLTKLPNRSLYIQLVDKSLQLAQRKQMQSALLFIDLNRFKPINDMLGHRVGDMLLVDVALRLKSVLRDQDIVARLGSDEFSVTLPEITTHSDASLVAQKILDSLEAVFSVESHDLRISASIGISIFPADGQDADSLLQSADIAMFQAKKTGHSLTGNYAFYDQAVNVHIAEKLFFESAIRKALKDNEFFLQYQPKIDVHSQRLISVEALLRWKHPERGLIPPVEFIGVAEETGLIVQMGEWVLEQACDQALRWKNAGFAPCRIAVNVSANEFSLALPARVAAALHKRKLEAEWLELEITESMLMQSSDTVISIMDQIVRLGVRLSLDDFGTGYSSLSYLKRFPIHTLKIDSSFVRGIPDDASDRAIANAIISMAKQLNYKVIAEGVETDAQLAFLKQAGCDDMQGYLFSYPLAAVQFEVLLRETLDVVVS